MIRTIQTPFCLAVLLLTAASALAPSVSAQSAAAQSPFDPAFNREAADVKEYLEVFTDRSTYLVNERIRFMALHRITGLDQDTPWSDVLCLELVSAAGQVFGTAKHPVTGGTGRGVLTIPGDMVSGIYYLKCYTRWMRNRGPATFSYLPLKIINPFRAEVTEYPDHRQESHPLERTSYNSGLLKLQSPSGSFSRGTRARFNLSARAEGTPDPIRCCVSVVPALAIDTDEGQYTGAETPAGDTGFALNYLPDLGGASISGRVLHRDGSPGAHATLHCSLLGSDPAYYVTNTDAGGRFVLSTLGHTGRYEAFVAAKPYGDQPVEIRIDQDFDQQELHLPGLPFLLSGDERETVTKMAIRMQLARTFQKEPGTYPAASPRTDRVSPDPGNPVNIPFYGTPGFGLDLDEFIDLPSIEEVFTNLVPVVNAVRKRDTRQLIIQGPNSTTALYPPLVMIDHIPVFDHGAVMDLLPERIRRIEVINEVYVRGNVSFGGIISILSRKEDMAGIDLPQGSYFFDFQALEPKAGEWIPAPGQGKRIPDTRNTILWIDDLVLEKGASAEITCIMPDQPGNYLVLVRGVTPEGTVHAASLPFRVE